VIQDTKYGVLFRAIVAGIFTVIGQKPHWAQHGQLRLVLESGHRNAADAVRLYEFCRSKIQHPRAHKAFGGLTFKTKNECLPLAAADHLAYAAYLYQTDGKGIGAPKKPLKMRQNYRQNCFYADVGPDSLESLYQQSIKFHEERQKFGRRIVTDESAA
jgi:hypothetical protein